MRASFLPEIYLCISTNLILWFVGGLGSSSCWRLISLLSSIRASRRSGTLQVAFAQDMKKMHMVPPLAPEASANDDSAEAPPGPPPIRVVARVRPAHPGPEQVRDSVLLANGRVGSVLRLQVRCG